jgi:hypothetical protein
MPAAPFIQPVMNWANYQQPQQQAAGGLGMPPAGLLNMIPGLGGDSAGGASGGGLSGLGSGMGAFALPAAIAAMIGIGKNTEANHPNTPEGDASLGLLGPSAAQIIKDPIGMGLPTLLGVPFITPFTGSQDAKKEKPEWSGFFGLGV